MSNPLPLLHEDDSEDDSSYDGEILQRGHQYFLHLSENSQGNFPSQPQNTRDSGDFRYSNETKNQTNPILISNSNHHSNRMHHLNQFSSQVQPSALAPVQQYNNSNSDTNSSSVSSLSASDNSNAIEFNNMLLKNCINTAIPNNTCTTEKFFANLPSNSCDSNVDGGFNSARGDEHRKNGKKKWWAF